MARSAKGDFAYENTGNVLLEFFSKAGSLRDKMTKAYEEASSDIMDLFKPCWKADKVTAMKLAMWCRDVRGGAGNRSGFRKIISWIAKQNPEWLKANMNCVPELGRWDDLSVLVDTPCEVEAIKLWVDAIKENNGLASKWAPREKADKILYGKMRRYAKMSPGDFRKMVAKNTKVVETVMCQKNWYDIEYNHVPGVAMSRYTKAFAKHDSVRFGEWKESLSKEGTENKVNASALFPHDCIRTLRAEGVYGKTCHLADAQFAALPNFMEGNKIRIMPICDFSGSMMSSASGMITCLDVSMSLGLYCSDRVGKDNPFYRKFIPFSTTSKLVTWKDKTFSKAVNELNDGYCGNTNVYGALAKIVEAAKMFNATDEQMPTMLLILSDMQFDLTGEEETAVEKGLRLWDNAGYTRPSIVYWDLLGYKTAPSTVNHKNVAMVSGFSPSILKSICSGTTITPMDIMNEALKKYTVIVP